LDPAIRKYFFSINIYLLNGYGMTECTAPQSGTRADKLILNKNSDYNEVGC
jgi:long-subunit acyl-CoA synthetase (AMP-forming)